MIVHNGILFIRRKDKTMNLEAKTVQSKRYSIKWNVQTQKHEFIMPLSYLNPILKLLNVCILCNLSNACIYHEVRMRITRQGKQNINDGKERNEGKRMYVAWLKVKIEQQGGC